MAAKEFIVAIELGSSKMTGIAGQKNLDGSIQVLAVVKENSSAFIRKGVVYNIDKTAQCLTSIVRKLETQLKTEIRQYRQDCSMPHQYCQEAGDSTQNRNPSGICRRRRSVHP